MMLTEQPGDGFDERLATSRAIEVITHLDGRVEKIELQATNTVDKRGIFEPHLHSHSCSVVGH